MENKLVSIEDIRIKENFNISLDDEKVLLDICTNIHINKDYRKELMNEKLTEKLLEYKKKFTPYKLEDVCTQIDKAVMNYDQKNANSNKVYDDDFFQLLQNLKKLKIDEKLMENLFPYYWKNRVKMLTNCFEEKNIEKLLNNLDKHNIDLCTNLFDSFNKNNFKDLSDILFNKYGGGNEFMDLFDNLLNKYGEGNSDKGLKLLCLRYGYFFESEKVKINQQFSFKTKLFDINQKQITIETGPLIYSSNAFIRKGNEITLNIEFEVNQINPLNDNKPITIKLIKK